MFALAAVFDFLFLFHLETAPTSVSGPCKIVAGVLLAIRECLLRDGVIRSNQVGAVCKHTQRGAN